MDRCTGRHCRPVLQLPTGQSCSLQTVGTDDKLLALKPILAHMAMNKGKRSKMEWGKAKLERGQELMRAVGMAGKIGSRQTARRTSTAGGHSQRILRPAQASKQTATDGHSCSNQQLPDDKVGLLSPCR